MDSIKRFFQLVCFALLCALDMLNRGPGRSSSGNRYIVGMRPCFSLADAAIDDLLHMPELDELNDFIDVTDFLNDIDFDLPKNEESGELDLS